MSTQLAGFKWLSRPLTMTFRLLSWYCLVVLFIVIRSIGSNWRLIPPLDSALKTHLFSLSSSIVWGYLRIFQVLNVDPWHMPSNFCFEAYDQDSYFSLSSSMHTDHLPSLWDVWDMPSNSCLTSKLLVNLSSSYLWSHLPMCHIERSFRLSLWSIPLFIHKTGFGCLGGYSWPKWVKQMDTDYWSAYWKLLDDLYQTLMLIGKWCGWNNLLFDCFGKC